MLPMSVWDWFTILDVGKILPGVAAGTALSLPFENQGVFDAGARHRIALKQYSGNAPPQPQVHGRLEKYCLKSPLEASPRILI